MKFLTFPVVGLVSLGALLWVRKSSGAASAIKAPNKARAVSMIPVETPKVGGGSVQREAGQPAPHLQNFIPVGGTIAPPNLTGEAMYNGEPLTDGSTPTLTFNNVITSPLFTVDRTDVPVSVENPIQPDMLTELAANGITADIQTTQRSLEPGVDLM